MYEILALNEEDTTVSLRQCCQNTWPTCRLVSRGPPEIPTFLYFML